MAKQPDILIYMSDQHTSAFSGWGEHKVDTPNLSSLRENGTSFDNAYTSSPLCVPARMSMMSALLPDKTGVYDNNYTLSNLIPCFTHALAAAGYETVLAGRMHFIGNDQRHGFTKRIAPDITPVSWRKPFPAIVKERGRTIKAFSSGGATDYAGTGKSIVTEYDDMVVRKTLEYLSEDHEKPQFILVGTFAPHFPYVADEDMFRKYLPRTGLPAFFNDCPEYVSMIPPLKAKMKGPETTEEIAIACQALYSALVEKMDSQFGAVRDAFKAFCRKRGNGYVAGYLSDHGDTAGERRMYGKQTYFEKSAKIPMLFEGDGIIPGRIIESPVSIMDLGPTVSELCGTTFRTEDSVSLKTVLEGGEEDKERIVASELIDTAKDVATASLMLRSGDFKYVLYHGYEPLLFNIREDPWEKEDLAGKLPGKMAWFDKLASAYDLSGMEKDFLRHRKAAALFRAFENETGYDDSERWKDNSRESTVLDNPVVDRIELMRKSW